MNLTDRIGRRMKLRDLHILLAVAQAGSMGRAASALSVSQPVISKAIAELEGTLGARLFDRAARGVVPTAYGQAMIHSSRAAFDELQQGVKAVEFLNDPTVGELRIGCTEFGTTALVPLVIDTLLQRHPGLRFHVMTAETVALATEELPQRRIELAVGGIPADLPADIHGERLFTDQHVIMAGIHSPWARRRKLALADLREGPWVLPPPGSLARQFIDGAFAANGLAPPLAQVSSFSTLLTNHMLATGRYLTILPREAVRMAKHLAIKPVNVAFAGIERSIGIMTLKHRTVSPQAGLFIDAMRLAAAAAMKSRR
jgi:DNA-binding transcriptional LysR family regulator